MSENGFYVIYALERTNLFLLYADAFHVPLQYSVKAARVASQCDSRVVVPVR